MSIRVWHDDVREPPTDSWVWAKTNAQARDLLRMCDVTEISLDHDLGAVDGQVRGHSPEGSGYDLVLWMIETKHLPERIVIHSHNYPGAKRMAQALSRAGKGCTRRPYNRTYLTSGGVSL